MRIRPNIPVLPRLIATAFSPLHFVATNAYWLHTLTRDDINKTLANIAASGIKVVRTWAFNGRTGICI